MTILSDLVKQVQQKQWEMYGEKEVVVMLGGIQIEMSTLNVEHLPGKIGWFQAFIEAEVANILVPE